jgi:aspartoacylase
LTDVVVDLHTTTANMGISLIIPEGDPLMAAAAAYVLHQCKTKYGYDSVQCLMHAMPTRADRQNLSSCGRHGFTIEVGPVPQGVLRHDVIEKTQSAMHSLLEFFQLRNLELQKGESINGDPTVLDELRRIYPKNIVPCYRSAPAVRPGELSGKISWPNDESNPNFPSVIVHKSLQDRDFQPLRIDDPLFVSLDGTVIPYDGSHGDEVHLIFVNEGGYYYASSKLATVSTAM